MITIITLTCKDRTKVLKLCIESVIRTLTEDYEYIIVDSNSCKDTEDLLFMYSKYPKIDVIRLKTNEGVCARNYGIEKAKGDIIVQVDDDVVLHNNWLQTIMPYFSDPKVGAVGVQGSYWNGWPMKFDHSCVTMGACVDFLTGYFWAFKNIGLKYDTNLGQFWHEESEIQIQIKNSGYKLKVCPLVCSHNSQRHGYVDWSLHDRNLKYIERKWKGKGILWERHKE
jgi:glycosyltransferase involved in cell wall biosynthesis